MSDVASITSGRGGAGWGCPPELEIGKGMRAHRSRACDAGDPHAAHAVTKAVDPEAGHVILQDLHSVALEVGPAEQ